MKAKIYHNPRCSKSRATLQLLQQHGLEPEVVSYLDTPPDEATLIDLARALGVTPLDLVRTGEPEYRESGLAAGTPKDREVVRALRRYPRLLQRPIVVTPKGARIGRPPEKVLEIL